MPCFVSLTSALQPLTRFCASCDIPGESLHIYKLNDLVGACIQYLWIFNQIVRQFYDSDQGRMHETYVTPQS